MTSSLEKFKEWTKKSKSIKERFEFLAENSTLSDFQFVVGPNLIIVPAHKLIFSVTSFDFFNLFVMSTPKDENFSIHLEDINYESFKEFIRYVYCDSIEIRFDNFFDILDLSLRYDIEHLTSLCLTKIPEIITGEDGERFAVSIMDFFHIWNKKLISGHFTQIIGKNPLKYISEENVYKLEEEHIAEILQTHQTETCESDYFKLAVMWAQTQCQTSKSKHVKPEIIRKVLGTLFFSIRFPAMSLEEFQECSTDKTGLFTNDEIIEIVLFIKNETKASRFYSKPRIGSLTKSPEIPEEEREIERLEIVRVAANNFPEMIESYENYISINVTVDKSVFIQGIYVMISPEIMKFWNKNLNFISIEATNENRTERFTGHTFKIVSPKNFPEFYLEQKILFDSPWHFKADTKYVICLESTLLSYFRNKNIFCKTGMSSFSVSDNVRFTFDSFDGSTSINKILFSKDTSFEISVKTMNDEIIKIEVGPDETVRSVKDRIQIEVGIISERQNILFEGRKLDDSQTLSYYNIENKSTLNVFLKFNFGIPID